VKISEVLKEAKISNGKALKVMWEELFEQIASPMAMFSNKLKCSPKDYQWLWMHPLTIVRKCNLQDHDLINWRTHAKITKDKLHNLAGDAAIGEYILTIYPKLYRIEADHKTRILISKGCLLVDLDRGSLPLAKKPRLSDSPKKREQTSSLKSKNDIQTQNQRMQDIPWTSTHDDDLWGTSQKEVLERNVQVVVPNGR
jgi:hypothetical protein